MAIFQIKKGLKYALNTRILVQFESEVNISDKNYFDIDGEHVSWIKVRDTDVKNYIYKLCYELGNDATYREYFSYGGRDNDAGNIQIPSKVRYLNTFNSTIHSVNRYEAARMNGNLKFKRSKMICSLIIRSLNCERTRIRKLHNREIKIKEVYFSPFNRNIEYEIQKLFTKF